jgi:hypothetical protein
MKKEIKMPGFTAEASVYKSSGCYYMVGGHGSSTRPVVGPAMADRLRLLHPMMPAPGGWDWFSDVWGAAAECGVWCSHQCSGAIGGSCWDLCFELNCYPGGLYYDEGELPY